MLLISHWHPRNEKGVPQLEPSECKIIGLLDDPTDNIAEAAAVLAEMVKNAAPAGGQSGEPRKEVGK